jgi:hypothetical protein
VQRMGSPLADDSLVFRDREVKMKNTLCGVLENRVNVGTNDVLDETAGRMVDGEGDVVAKTNK